MHFKRWATGWCTMSLVSGWCQFSAIASLNQMVVKHILSPYHGLFFKTRPVLLKSSSRNVSCWCGFILRGPQQQNNMNIEQMNKGHRFRCWDRRNQSTFWRETVQKAVRNMPKIHWTHDFGKFWISNVHKLSENCTLSQFMCLFS